MPYSTAQTALETYFQTNWTDTPITFENMSYMPNSNSFVRFSVQFAKPVVSSLGAKCFRYFGTVFIQVFTKSNTGVATAMTLADQVSALFRAQQIGIYQFGVPSVMKVYPGEDNWMQANVSCGFIFHDMEA